MAATQRPMPFETLESAQEFVHLLLSETQTADREIHSLITQTAADSRQIEALRLVAYKLSQLRKHMEASCRVLNDLRTLRSLLIREPEERS